MPEMVSSREESLSLSLSMVGPKRKNSTSSKFLLLPSLMGGMWCCVQGVDSQGTPTIATDEGVNILR